MENSCNIRGVLGSLLVCCCQSLPFFQWDVKCLNFINSDFIMAFGLYIAATTLIQVNKCRKSSFKTTVSSTWFTLHKITRTCSTSLLFGVYNFHLCLYTVLCYFSNSCGWAKMTELWIRTGKNVFYERLCWVVNARSQLKLWKIISKKKDLIKERERL